MDAITIKRWAKGRSVRGYAKAVDGAELGWIDLKTGAITLEDGADAVAVTAALQAWGETNPFVQSPSDVAAPVALESAVPAPITYEPGATLAMALPPVSAAAPRPAPVAARALEPPPEQQPTWHDLAEHRPGQLVRAQAIAEWEASKERSKFIAYVARYVFRNQTDEWRWRVGAQGEEVMGSRLEHLHGEGWQILHSVPVGKNDTDIDHLAIGPGGVFTLNTKNHSRCNVWVGAKRIMVNGKPVDHLPKSAGEARRASRLLTATVGYLVEVEPVLALFASRFTIKERPVDVAVLGSREVVRWLKRRPAVLTPEQVEAIYAVARRSDTWV